MILLNIFIDPPASPSAAATNPHMCCYVLIDTNAAIAGPGHELHCHAYEAYVDVLVTCSLTLCCWPEAAAHVG